MQTPNSDKIINAVMIMVAQQKKSHGSSKLRELDLLLMGWSIKMGFVFWAKYCIRYDKSA